MKKLISLRINKKTRFTLRKAVIILIIVLLLIEQNAYFFPSTLHAEESASESASVEEMLDIRRANEALKSKSDASIEKDKIDEDLLDDLTKSPEIVKGLRERVTVQSLAKKSFQYKEKILFNVYYASKDGVKVVVKDSSGTEVPVQVSENRLEDDTVRLALSAPWKMKPGNYSLEVVEGEKVVSTQQFTWGVLALNPNKSIYMFNEKAHFSIAVLDEKGEMVCDASVELTVKDPLGSQKTLSSKNQEILTTDQCHSKELSITPDYETEMQLGDVPGNYEVQLKAQTKNGSYKVEDMFEVRELVDFDITRSSATRLYPTHFYPVEIDIKMNADFKGRITEIVPENFEIIQSTSSAVLPFSKVEELSESEAVSEKVLGARALRLPFEDEHEVTLGFGQDILDPKLRGVYKDYGVVAHDGTDFAAPIGTPVYPLDAGTVVLADENGDYGVTLVIQHEWGRSYYGHLSEFKKQVGDSVYKDDVVALSGNSGLSTGEHLHLGVKLNKNDSENGFFGKTNPATLLGMESDGKVLGEAIDPRVNVRVVTWEVDVKRGDTLKLGYQFKSPPESPQFYRLGPLRMYDADDSLAFQEPRQWQLAIDASNYVGRHIKTVEYSFGNSYSGTTNSLQDLFSTDDGVGSVDGWTTTGPAQADDGIDVVLEGTDISIVDAWVEFTATATGAASLSDLDIAMSTCPGSEGTCTNAPVYRALPLFGTPGNIYYAVNSAEIYKFSVKANAEAAFDGISDSEWEAGVETIIKTASTGPGLSLQTAKLILTYESDFDAAAHEEVKTVRFPLDSDVSGDTGSKRTSITAGSNQTFTYNANIPDLDSDSDILDVYFEIYGQISATASNGTLTARVVSGTPTDSPAFRTVTSTGVTSGFYGFFRPAIGANDFQPNTSQQLRLAPATNAVSAAGGELVVTYRYSTDEPSQTETVRFFANQLTASGSNAKNTATIAPSISNTGASVSNIWARVHAANTAASTSLTIYGDIDSGGGVSEKSNAYTLAFTGTEQVNQPRIVYDMTADAGSFVSGGDMTVSTQWSNTSGNPASVEVFITFTWDGDDGGEQTKSVQYYMENSKLGGTAGTTAQNMRSTLIRLQFPETATKNLQSAYTETFVNSSDTTTPIQLNQGVNESSITANGTGFVNYVNTGEAMSFVTLEDIESYVDASQQSQKLSYNYRTDATSGYSPKAIATYDVDFSETGTTVPDKQIRTVEYSFGNSNASSVAASTNVYATGNGTGNTNGWTTTAPTQADAGILVKLEGTNIVVKQAWVEFRAQTTVAGSMSDMDISLSTCQGSVSTCTNAPVYRSLPLFGTPTNIFYFVNSGETNVFYVKANASPAFDGLSDSDWTTGVETILRAMATAASVNSTAKLVLTYESDFSSTPHDEVKTVRFPLDSNNGTDTGSRQAQLAAAGNQSFDYNANIPDLDSNSDIYDVYFEIYAQSGNTSGSLTARVVSGSQTDSPGFPTIGGATATTQANHFIFRPTIGTNNFEPNTAQQLNITATIAALNALGGELVITYKYSTDEVSQTETVKYFANQLATSANGTKNTATIAPVISNTGASVSNIYAKVNAENFAASSLQVFGDIDSGGATSEKSNTYVLQFGSEMIAAHTMIYDMTADAGSFVSGGDMTVSTDWSNTSGGPPSVEVYITFTWDGDLGGTQTKTVQYYMENSKLGGSSVTTAQEQRNVGINMHFPESVTKTLRSAYVENWITSSDTTTINLNHTINEHLISATGTGFIAYNASGESMTVLALEDISSYVAVSQPSQALIYNFLGDSTMSFSPKTVVTYDAQFTANAVPNAPVLSAPFDNEKTADTTPNFEFTGTDTEGNDITYHIQVDDAYNFSSVIIECESDTSCATGSGSFSNTVDGGDTDPFTENEKVRFAPSTALSNGTTYYWRVRASDAGGYGSYSTIYSVTIDTGLSLSSWFQTTDEQFATDTLTDTETTGSDSVELIGGGGGITVSNLTSDERTSVGNTPQSTASIAPDADSLILAWIITTRSAGEPNLNEDEAEASISGLGLTWTFVGSTHYSDRRIMHLFAAVTDESPSSGSLTITQINIFNPQDIAWIIDQYEGVDTADPYGMLYYSTENSGTSESVTISDTPDTGDVTVAAVGEENAQTVTREAGWELILNLDASTNVRRLQTIYDPDQDTTPSWSWSSSAGSAALGLVVNAAAASSGTIMSPEIDYDWVAGATSWGNAVFSTTETNGDIKVSLYYTSSTACDTIIPNAALSGNESGFDVSSSPIDISGLNTTTYNRICMEATLTDSGGTPFLNDWTIEWEGSGIEIPNLSQLMRHGSWFGSLGVIQPFTF